MSNEEFIIRLMDESARNDGYSNWEQMETFLIEKNYKPRYVINEVVRLFLQVCVDLASTDGVKNEIEKLKTMRAAENQLKSKTGPEGDK
ncbi:MAG: hypothetical protein J7599_07575 [Niabella sp.]|nr:hypothetical protein [Niabella sp.]